MLGGQRRTGPVVPAAVWRDLPDPAAPWARCRRMPQRVAALSTVPDRSTAGLDWLRRGLATSRASLLPAGGAVRTIVTVSATVAARGQRPSGVVVPVVETPLGVTVRGVLDAVFAGVL